MSYKLIGLASKGCCEARQSWEDVKNLIFSFWVVALSILAYGVNLDDNKNLSMTT